MKNNLPDRIYVGIEDRETYHRIKQILGKKFYNADIFSLAMVYGYMNNVRIPLTRKTDFFRTVPARDNFYSLLVMLYFNETGSFPNDFDELSEAFNIAQEYAHGGLKLLEKDIREDIYGFDDKLASKILKYNSNPNFSDRLRYFGI